MVPRPFPPGVRAADAEEFVFRHGRLLERRRVHRLLHGGGLDGVLAALGAYRNPDGGFGHGLEPDVRSPHSEPLATLTALDLLASWDLPDHPWVRAGLEWAAAGSDLDGAVPLIGGSSLEWPHAPWLQAATGGSHLTHGFAAVALLTGFEGGWTEAAVAWGRGRLTAPDALHPDGTLGLPAYEVKYAVRLLTALGVADPQGHPVLTAVGESLRRDGSLPVSGGAEGEAISAVDLLHSPWSRPFPSELPGRLAPADVLTAGLGRLAAGQREDGGWTVDWPAWSPAQGLEWRGIRTVEALELLAR